MKITNRLKFISIIILAAAILIAGAGTKLTDFFGENFKIPNSENNSTQNNQSSSNSEETSRLPDEEVRGLWVSYIDLNMSVIDYCIKFAFKGFL